MIAPEDLRRVQRQVHKLSQTRINGAGGSLSGLRRLRGADRSTGARHSEEMRALRSLAPVVPVSQAPTVPCHDAGPLCWRPQCPPVPSATELTIASLVVNGEGCHGRSHAPVLEGCGEPNLRHRMDSTSGASAVMLRTPRRERLT